MIVFFLKVAILLSGSAPIAGYQLVNSSFDLKADINLDLPRFGEQNHSDISREALSP